MPQTRRPLAQRRPPELRPRRQGRRLRDPAELGDAALRHPGLWVRVRQGERRRVRVLRRRKLDGQRGVQMRVLRVPEREINENVPPSLSLQLQTLDDDVDVVCASDHEGELEHDDRGDQGDPGAVQKGARRQVPRLDEEQGAAGTHRIRTFNFR